MEVTPDMMIRQVNRELAVLRPRLALHQDIVAGLETACKAVEAFKPTMGLDAISPLAQGILAGLQAQLKQSRLNVAEASEGIRQFEEQLKVLGSQVRGAGLIAPTDIHGGGRFSGGGKR